MEFTTDNKPFLAGCVYKLHKMIDCISTAMDYLCHFESEKDMAFAEFQSDLYCTRLLPFRFTC